MNLKSVSELICLPYFSLAMGNHVGKSSRLQWLSGFVQHAICIICPTCHLHHLSNMPSASFVQHAVCIICPTCCLHHFHVHVCEPSSGVSVYTYRTLQKSVVLGRMLATKLLFCSYSSRCAVIT